MPELMGFSMLTCF